jgi:hypothetical protein
VIGAIVLAERHLGIGAINAARAGIGQMAHFGMTAAFQNVGESDQIASDIRIRIFETVAYPCLCSQVDHSIKGTILGKASPEFNSIS